MKDTELRILDKIEELIKSAGEDSYIADTFDGIVEVCRNNIRNDFGDRPVQDLEDMRKRFDAEVRMHDEDKRIIDVSQTMCKAALDECERLRKQVAELTDQRDCMAECVDGNNHIIDEAEAEIRKLKAEIVKMRMERMDNNAMALMYDRMRGDFDD